MAAVQGRRHQTPSLSKSYIAFYLAARCFDGFPWLTRLSSRNFWGFGAKSCASDDEIAHNYSAVQLCAHVADGRTRKGVEARLKMRRTENGQTSTAFSPPPARRQTPL